MNSRHVTFFILPNHPHVGPTLPIVYVLVRRGYRATYWTSERFAVRVAALGAEVLAHDWRPKLTSPDDVHNELTLRINQQMADMERAFETRKPDLLVYDEWGFAGLLFARRWCIPAVYIGPSFVHEKCAHVRQLPSTHFRESWVTWSKVVDGVLHDFGLHGIEWIFHREMLNILLFPRIFQPCADAVAGNCLYAGRCPGEQPCYGTWAPPASDDCRPVVLVSTSTNYVQGPSYFKLCVQALSGLHVRVILSIGDDNDPESIGVLPDNFEIVQHVSHVKILPFVSLFICLGGIVTSAEAAYHGVPLVVTSLGAPELEWQADNLVDIGIAVHIKGPELDSATLRLAAVQVLENVTMNTRVKFVQRVVRREAGAEEAANQIEEYLAARR